MDTKTTTPKDPIQALADRIIRLAGTYKPLPSVPGLVDLTGADKREIKAALSLLGADEWIAYRNRIAYRRAPRPGDDPPNPYVQAVVALRTTMSRPEFLGETREELGARFPEISGEALRIAIIATRPNARLGSGTKLTVDLLAPGELIGIEQHIQTQLRDLAGAYKPGDQLPTQREIAAHYAVSKATVGNAVAPLLDSGKVLDADKGGLVIAHPEDPARARQIEARSLARDLRDVRQAGIIANRLHLGRKPIDPVLEEIVAQTPLGEVLPGALALAAQVEASLGLAPGALNPTQVRNGVGQLAQNGSTARTMGRSPRWRVVAGEERLPFATLTPERRIRDVGRALVTLAEETAVPPLSVVAGEPSGYPRDRRGSPRGTTTVGNPGVRAKQLPHNSRFAKQARWSPRRTLAGVSGRSGRARPHAGGRDPP